MRAEFPNMGMDRPAYFFVIIINSLLANFLRRRSPTEQLQTTTSPWLPCLPHEKHLYIIKMFCFGCTNSQIQFYRFFLQQIMKGTWMLGAKYIYEKIIYIWRSLRVTRAAWFYANSVPSRFLKFPGIHILNTTSYRYPNAKYHIIWVSKC